MADNAKARQNHDVHFGMAKEPEQVLIQDRVAAAGRVKKGRAKVTVGQQHGNGTAQNRHGEQKQEGRHQHRPGKKRHFMQGHARCAHIANGGDKVNRPQD